MCILILASLQFRCQVCRVYSREGSAYCVPNQCSCIFAIIHLAEKSWDSAEWSDRPDCTQVSTAEHGQNIFNFRQCLSHFVIPQNHVSHHDWVLSSAVMVNTPNAKWRRFHRFTVLQTSYRNYICSKSWSECDLNENTKTNISEWIIICTTKLL